MAKYRDSKAGLTFKKVFGEHKELLISFHNALLPLQPGKEIVSVEYLPAELVPINPDKTFAYGTKVNSNYSLGTSLD